MRRRLANAYLSSVVSISLVLLLVGVSSMILVNAKAVTDYFKQNLQVSVIMKPTVPESDALMFRKELDSMVFVHGTEFISKEQEKRKWRICSERIF